MLRWIVLLVFVMMAGCDGPSTPAIGEAKTYERGIVQDGYAAIEKGNGTTTEFQKITAVQTYEYQGHRYLRFYTRGEFNAEQTPVHDPDCPKCLKRVQ